MLAGLFFDYSESNLDHTESDFKIFLLDGSGLW